GAHDDQPAALPVELETDVAEVAAVQDARVGYTVEAAASHDEAHERLGLVLLPERSDHVPVTGAVGNEAVRRYEYPAYTLDGRGRQVDVQTGKVLLELGAVAVASRGVGPHRSGAFGMMARPARLAAGGTG